MDKDRIQAPNVPSESATFAELASFQGIAPVFEFESLLGHPSAEDETDDEFSAMLREWRREGGPHAAHR